MTGRSDAVDGFRLAYDRFGGGAPAVLLHGWPGGRGDHREVAALLAHAADVIVPDLRGFGESDRRSDAPAEAYSAAGQAESVLGLMDELGIESAVIAGYDIGSRTAQQMAASAPGRVRALVVSPPVPGAGRRVLSADAQPEFWYQHFHRLTLPEALIDGRPDAVRAYIGHFWEHWSAPGFTPPADHLDQLTARYAEPGAFTAGLNWYRAGSGTIARSLAEREPDPADRIAVPTTVLWPGRDPLFPPEWSDRLDAFFADAELLELPGCGHFVPLEAPAAFADAILERLA